MNLGIRDFLTPVSGMAVAVQSMRLRCHLERYSESEDFRGSTVTTVRSIWQQQPQNLPAITPSHSAASPECRINDRFVWEKSHSENIWTSRICYLWRLRYHEGRYGSIKTLDWCIHVKRSHWAGYVVKMMDNNSKTNSGRESQSKKACWKAEEQMERRSVELRRKIAQY